VDGLVRICRECVLNVCICFAYKFFCADFARGRVGPGGWVAYAKSFSAYAGPTRRSGGRGPSESSNR
jgi:hypothetical protein